MINKKFNVIYEAMGDDEFTVHSVYETEKEALEAAKVCCEEIGGAAWVSKDIYLVKYSPKIIIRKVK